MHPIDLSNVQMHTDLIVDVISTNKKYQEEKKEFKGGNLSRIILDQKGGVEVGKKPGIYTTISFLDASDHEIQEEVIQILKEEILFYLNHFSLKKDAVALVIGLGNRESTPDALGSLALKRITVTRHLFQMGLSIEQGFRPLASIAPGVMAQTGIETQDYLLSILKTVKPDFVIAIDSLASNSLNRLMKTIQLTDTGIHPGSGIGNNRKEISKETIHIPVLAIGVPTVVDAATIVQNTLEYLTKKISYQKENGKLLKSKFLTGTENTYEKQKDTLNLHEKKSLLGEVGTLKEEEQIALFEEVLNPLGYNLMVTPTEVDFMMEHLAKIIGLSLEESLHQKK